jgi:Na+(H+)/acetate symporter ActP
LGVLEDSKFPLLGVWASPSHLAQSWVTTFSFLAFASTLLFQKFFPGIFFFSRKKNKKTIEKKRNVEKGGSFPSSSHFAFSILTFTFALALLPFYFKRFFLAYSSSQAKEE